jgi:hypothetical protein
MYRKILNDPLKFPEWLSKPAMEMLSRLIERDIEKRAGPEIKQSEFFKGLNFEELMKKNVKPPYLPTVVSGLCDHRCRIFFSPHFVLSGLL